MAESLVPGSNRIAAIAAITAAELLTGVHNADEAHRVPRSAFVEGVLATMPIVPSDLTAARLYAEVAADLANSGVPYRPERRARAGFPPWHSGAPWPRSIMLTSPAFQAGAERSE